MTNYKRLENEDFDTYALRLYRNKAEYDLNSRDIAVLLNEHSEIQKEESSFRKYYKAFRDGIEYERKRHSSGIATRILSISDCHVPFQLPIEKLEKYKNRVDILQLNGDIGDCQAISSYPKIYRKSPMEEIIETRQFIVDLIEYINPKKVVVTFGNHDARFQTYLAKNLDTDILELMPQTSLELIFTDGFKHYNKRERTKIDYKPLKEVFPDVEIQYTNNWFVQIGDCIFCHPKAFSSGILKTAEKAMLWFRNEDYNFKTLVMAHTHRSGMYSIGNTTIYEQGAFCDVKANNYADGKLYNSQKEGFIYLCQDMNGNTLRNRTELVVLNWKENFMNFKEFINYYTEKNDMSKNKAEGEINRFISSFKQAVVDKGVVNINEFVKGEVFRTVSKEIFLPRTQEKIIIPAKTKIRVKAKPAFANMIESGEK